jgi:Ca2+-binding RTX toxin-like protein
MVAKNLPTNLPSEYITDSPARDDIPQATIIGTNGIDITGKNIFNTIGDDVIVGLDGNDKIKGGKGDDTLRGNNGHDTLEGEEGNDVLFGDSGNDKLYGGEGNDTLYGGTGNDKLYGDLGNDLLLGEAGIDLLEGGKGKDILFGGLGNDKDSVVTVKHRPVHIEGGLYGGEGNDIVVGGQGADRIIGGEGEDILVGGDASVKKTLNPWTHVETTEVIVGKYSDKSRDVFVFSCEDSFEGPVKEYYKETDPLSGTVTEHIKYRPSYDTIKDFDVKNDVIELKFDFSEAFMKLGADDKYRYFKDAMISSTAVNEHGEAQSAFFSKGGNTYIGAAPELGLGGHLGSLTGGAKLNESFIVLENVNIEDLGQANFCFVDCEPRHPNTWG